MSTCQSCEYCTTEPDETGESANVCMAMPPAFVVIDGEPNYIRGAYINAEDRSCIYFVPAAKPKSNARH